jgi:hypothetical protein
MMYKDLSLMIQIGLNGSVINYTLTNCTECGNKIRVVNHVS